MKLVLILIGTTILSLMVTSCGESTVLPEGNNHYRVVADGVTKTDALDRANKQALAQCDSTHKKLVAGSNQYTSNDGDAKDVKKSGSMSQQTLSMLNPNEYHVVLNFSCV